MTRYYLTRLQIEGFRGINNEGAPLDLRFKETAVNSVWAANGLGKSSIYEALSYAIRGSIPKLDRLQAAERPQDYYCNRFHQSEAVIALTFKPDDGGADVVIEVERSKAGARSVSSSSGHSDPEAFLRDLSEDYALLDYSTFTSFVEDSALDRGRAFSSLLGMQYLSVFRQALEQLAHRRNLETDFGLQQLQQQSQSASSKLATTTAELRSAHEKLLGSLPSEPIDHDAIIAAGTGALAAIDVLRSTFEDHDLSTVDFETALVAIKKAEGSEKRERLAQVLRLISSFESLASSDADKDEQDRLARLLAERDAALEGTRGPLSQRMYESVKAVLESAEWPDDERCPVCESVPDTPPAQLVEKKIQNYSTASSKQREIVAGWNGATWVSRMRQLETQLAVAEGELKLPHLDTTFRQRTPSDGDLRTAVDYAATLEEKRQERLATLKGDKDSLEKEIPPSLVTLTEQVEAARRLRDLVATHRSAVAKGGELSLVKARIAQREQWSEFITRSSGLFGRAEAELSKSVTAEMEAEYKSMYGAIVRNSDVLPALDKPSDSEVLHLKLDRFFNLEGVSARALLSESYRNAFAISVFLSASLRKSAPPRFVILDDVTSSFDAGHQWNLMEQLRKTVGVPVNPDGLQVIVLSHDGLLEKYFDKLSNTQEWHHQKLHGSPPTGAVFTQAQQADRLRSQAERFLQAGQTAQAEPLIRQYLEYKLLQVITRVRIPVPLDFAIRNDRHMVSNCLEAINAALDLHDAAGSLILEPTQRSDLKNTHVPTIVANWVSHYETSVSSSLAPTVLLGVLDSIDELADCFRFDDSASGATVRTYYRSLDRKV